MSEYLQTVKIALILCSCFFAYGSYWSDWAFDYFLLWTNPLEHPEAISRATFYYANQAHIPNILKYVPIVNLLIAATGFATGIVNMTDGNLLFDGASLVLLFFGISTHFSSVKPAVTTVTVSNDLEEITKSLKNIAAAHFIIVLAITGIIGLQITHYFVMKKSHKEYSGKGKKQDQEQEEQDEESQDEDDEDEERIKGKDQKSV
ncbi:ER membrane protein SH3 [Backusella circina FSU 941]|nr:ER membrane protein SH3 [Backusella circina FSU 941]